MKFLLGLLLGVITGAFVAIVGNNASWRAEAFDHYAAVYYTDDIINHPDLEWSWADDYWRTHGIRH